jgi:L,D-transpeptidase catalytic domain
MKKRIRGFYLLVSSVVIGLLHLPFAFAKSANGNKLFHTKVPADSTEKINPTPISPAPAVKSVYDSLQLNLRGLSAEAYAFAKAGLQKLVEEGKLLNDSIISIIDFSLPSNQKRLFVLDLKKYKVLFNTLVAHGRNTGREWAVAFSNQGESYKSSPGFYITRETYEGKNGYSLKLAGIEKGINDQAFDRGIVVHGAEYVSQDLANAQGYIGRSQGCPAVPVQVSRPLINTIKNGTCLFIYHPAYVRQSKVLN